MGLGVAGDSMGSGLWDGTVAGVNGTSMLRFLGNSIVLTGPRTLTRVGG
ncbi:hypothetical protein ES702_03417 [subsurface metagenome]